MALTDKYKEKWLEKLLSLVVSGKMIFFFSILSVCTVLVSLSLITPTVFGAVLGATITNVCIMRGIVQISEINKNGKDKEVDI